MKKTRIVSLLLLVVVCTVALCACQPEQQQIAQEDFAWVETFGMMSIQPQTSLSYASVYPIELLTDLPYKMVEHGNVFVDSTDIFVKGKYLLLRAGVGNTMPSEQGEWGYAYHSFVVLYFLDDSQNVVGYAVVELWYMELIVYTATFLYDDSSNSVSTKQIDFRSHAQIVKSVKFTDGAIPFEQAQSIVESQLDLPQQSAN